MFRFSLLILTVFLSWSCIKQSTPTRGSSVSLDDYSEDISYLLPKYTEVKPESTKPKVEATLPKKEVSFVDENEKVNLVLNKIAEANKEANLSGHGYRIQVFAGNVKADFENARSYLYRNFPELEVYESYSQPTYRIKAGDFIYYQDAEKYTNVLKQRFGSIRIVSEKINVKKAINAKN